MNIDQISNATTAYIVLHYLGLSLLFTSMIIFVAMPFRRHSPDLGSVQRRFQILSAISALVVGICLYIVADVIRPAHVEPRFVLPIGESQRWSLTRITHRKKVHEMIDLSTIITT